MPPLPLKFVRLYFHLASDVGKRWLGHTLSEISWRSMATFEVNVPSARSDPTRNRHKDHVVPAGYGINCKCDYEGKKKKLDLNFRFDPFETFPPPGSSFCYRL